MTHEHRFVDYFLVVGLDAVAEIRSASDLIMSQKKACILDRFPVADIPGCAVNGSLEMIPLFCFPSGVTLKVGKNPPLPTSFPFIFTLGDGGHSYVTCVTFFEPIRTHNLGGSHTLKDTSGLRYFAPKCICLVSQWPYFEGFKQLLNRIYQLSLSGITSLEVVIANITQLYLPSPCNRTILVEGALGSENIQFCIPPSWGLPHFDLSFEPLFRCLDIDNVLSVIALILMEKSILLVSNQDSVPPTVCEILRVLLFPFDVTANVYIPRLPESLSDVLESPVPFLIGMTSKAADWIGGIASLIEQKQLPVGVILVDLDNNLLWTPSSLVQSDIDISEAKRRPRRAGEITGTTEPKLVLRFPRRLTAQKHAHLDSGVAFELGMSNVGPCSLEGGLSDFYEITAWEILPKEICASFRARLEFETRLCRCAPQPQRQPHSLSRVNLCSIGHESPPTVVGSYDSAFTFASMDLPDGGEATALFTRSVRDAAFCFFSKLLLNYSSFVSVHTRRDRASCGSGPIFDEAAFIAQVPAAHVSFLRRILPTSLFAHLVGTRYIGENVSLLFFDASFRKIDSMREGNLMPLKKRHEKFIIRQLSPGDSTPDFGGESRRSFLLLDWMQGVVDLKEISGDDNGGSSSSRLRGLSRVSRGANFGLVVDEIYIYDLLANPSPPLPEVGSFGITKMGTDDDHCAVGSATSILLDDKCERNPNDIQELGRLGVLVGREPMVTRIAEGVYHSSDSVVAGPRDAVDTIVNSTPSDLLPRRMILSQAKNDDSQRLIATLWPQLRYCRLHSLVGCVPVLLQHATYEQISPHPELASVVGVSLVDVVKQEKRCYEPESGVYRPPLSSSSLIQRRGTFGLRGALRSFVSPPTTPAAQSSIQRLKCNIYISKLDTWKSRYFVLDSVAGFFYYSQSRHVKNQNDLIRFMFLEFILYSTCSSIALTLTQIRCEITPSKRTQWLHHQGFTKLYWILAAKSESERDEWLEHLRDAIISAGGAPFRELRGRSLTYSLRFQLNQTFDKAGKPVSAFYRATESSFGSDKEYAVEVLSRAGLSTLQAPLCMVSCVSHGIVGMDIKKARGGSGPINMASGIMMDMKAESEETSHPSSGEEICFAAAPAKCAQAARAVFMNTSGLEKLIFSLGQMLEIRTFKNCPYLVTLLEVVEQADRISIVQDYAAGGAVMSWSAETSTFTSPPAVRNLLGAVDFFDFVKVTEASSDDKSNSNAPNKESTQLVRTALRGEADDFQTPQVSMLSQLKLSVEIEDMKISTRACPEGFPSASFLTNSSSASCDSLINVECDVEDLSDDCSEGVVIDRSISSDAGGLNHEDSVASPALGSQLLGSGVGSGLDEIAIRRVFTSVVHGLASLHAQHVVHRDINPCNVLLDGRGQAKISRYWDAHLTSGDPKSLACGECAKAGQSLAVYAAASVVQNLGRGARTSLRASMELSPRVPLARGMHNFLAPEALSGRPFDGYAADVWALGVTLFSLVSGKLPTLTIGCHSCSDEKYYGALNLLFPFAALGFATPTMPPRSDPPRLPEMLAPEESLCFDMVLSTPILLQQFRVYVQGEKSEENLNFFLAVEQYRANYAIELAGATCSKALDIINLFIYPGASEAVTLPAKLVMNILAAFDEAVLKSSAPDIDLFDLAASEVKRVMCADIFRRFIVNNDIPLYLDEDHGETCSCDVSIQCNNSVTQLCLELPSSTSPQLVDLMSKMLESNPSTRIKLDDIQNHPWIMAKMCSH